VAHANSSQWAWYLEDKVHICFDNSPGGCDFTNLSAYNQTALIIHEVAHRYVGIRDQAYFMIHNKLILMCQDTSVQLSSKMR